MRQAGRYLPEYRELRSRVPSILELLGEPELAARITLQPVRRFELDAAILFSDILVVPEVMDLGLYFEEGEGPRFRHPVRTPAQVEALPVPGPEAYPKVAQTVRRVLEELDGSLPLIGFAGSPWTLAAYVLEGRGGGEFGTARALAYQEPDLVHGLLRKLSRGVVAFLQAQLHAGVHALQIFDTWGGLLSHRGWEEFSLAYMRQVVDQIRQSHPRVPVTLYGRNTAGRLEQLAATGCDCLSLDWSVDMGRARRQTGGEVALQGNLDPVALHAPPEELRRQVAATLASYGRGPGHIFNLGHGVAPDVDPEQVQRMIRAVQELSPPYHAVKS